MKETWTARLPLVAWLRRERMSRLTALWSRKVMSKRRLRSLLKPVEAVYWLCWS